MHCSNCNIGLTDGQQFCTNCGQKIMAIKSVNSKILPKIESARTFFAKKALMVIFLAAALFFAFYWFSYLPKQYRANCYKTAVSEVGGYQNTKSKMGMDWYGNAYKKCLASHGLN